MNKNRILRILSKTLLLGAFLIFLASALSPFLNIINTGIMHEYGYAVVYWSYKSEVTHWTLGHFPETEVISLNDYWFAPLWYNPPSVAFFGLSWILVATFVAQLLTLCSSIAALLTRHRKLLLLPLFTCISVIFLTTYAEEQINRMRYGPIFDQGYWLAFPSACLFFLAWISIARNPSAREKPMENGRLRAHSHMLGKEKLLTEWLRKHIWRVMHFRVLQF